MATVVPDIPAEQPESVGSDLLGMGSFFIDPPGAARRVYSKWFWVGPLVVFSIVSMIASSMMMPLVQHVLEVTPLPPNVSPEQYQRGIDMSLKFQRIGMYVAPLIAAVLFALQAAVLLGMSSVTSVKASFRELFNLVAGCALIQVLASIASLFILRAKGEITTMAELRPALGLDIFLPEGTNKMLVALLGYFSVFEIWWIVMMVLIFSTAFRVGKGKAFAVISPLILLAILFRLVGAAFQR